MVGKIRFMKNIFTITVLFSTLAMCIDSLAQNTVQKAEKGTETVAAKSELRELYPRKGKYFVYWGYNRAAYSPSTIEFKEGWYDFTIHDVRATDAPTNPNSQYYGLTTFTIPQFNVRVGYYLNDKNFISFGFDHMRYTMSKQSARLSGHINTGANAGTYNNTEVVVGEDAEVANSGESIIEKLPGGFVTNYEHCDGLNDFTFEAGHLEQIWISKNRKHALCVVGTAGIGGVITDTDADVLGMAPRHDMEGNKKAYHLAGYSFCTSMGLQFDFCKRGFFLFKVKAGYMNLPDIFTTMEGGRASQHFTYIEPMGVFGYNFALKKHKKQQA